LNSDIPLIPKIAIKKEYNTNHNKESKKDNNKKKSEKEKKIKSQ
jgi:hypothetical protein